MIDDEHKKERTNLNHKIDEAIGDKLRMEQLKRDIENEQMGVAIDSQRM